jgi:hypothetical protein
MIPIKIECGCGQKYAFDVELVNGQMATAIACPVCGIDGTAVANQILSQTLATQAPAAAPRLRMAPAATPPQAPAPQVATASLITDPVAPPIKRLPPAISYTGDFSLGRGIAGALIGAAVGSGAMYGFYMWAGFRFPLLGVGIGALTGFLAKTLARGTESTLGVISGVIALLAVVGTLYLMYGEFPILSIISVVVSVSVAYRTASG